MAQELKHEELQALHCYSRVQPEGFMRLSFKGFFRGCSMIVFRICKVAFNAPSWVSVLVPLAEANRRSGEPDVYKGFTGPGASTSWALDRLQCEDTTSLQKKREAASVLKVVAVCKGPGVLDRFQVSS